MTGGYSISITFRNAEMFARQAAKLKDFTTLFERLRDKWVEHNRDKFEKSQGASEMGVAFPDGVFWQELSEEYFAEKERAGYDDWLMVRTGDLMRSLTEKAGDWFEMIEPLAAMYGTTDPKASYNFETRPTVFLDPVDRLNITELLMAFLEDRSPFSSRYGTDTSVEYGGAA